MTNTQVEQGPRAAWGYLRLAWRALMGGSAVNEPGVAPPTRRYLVACVIVYGYFALSFLTHIPGIGGGKVGLDIIDAQPWHTLWGLAMLSVSLIQFAALFGRFRIVWWLTSVWTAAVAFALEFVTLLIAIHFFSFTLVVLWGFVTYMHYEFVTNQLVPIPPLLNEDIEVELPTEDRQALDRLSAAIAQPTPAARSGRSRRVPSTAHAGEHN